MLVLAMSSAKPESLNTMRVSTAGASSLTPCDDARANGSITSLVRSVGEAGDQCAAAYGMDLLPAIVFVSIGTQRSSPSFSNSS